VRPKDPRDRPDNRQLKERNLKKVRSAGVILFRDAPQRQFLVLKHGQRCDLPKGHLRKHEDDLQAAIRELREETGLTAEQVRLDDEFRFSITYFPRYRRLGGKRVHKTVTIFVGQLVEDQPVRVREHDGHEWIAWDPPHQLGNDTVDQVLVRVQQHLQGQVGDSRGDR